MEAVATLVKVTLPKYLSQLPIPRSVGELSDISGCDWFQLSIFMLTVGVIFYSVVRLISPKVDKGPRGKGQPINECIRKDSPKVVDLLDIEDLDKEKVSYCRCWKSKKVITDLRRPLFDIANNEEFKWFIANNEGFEWFFNNFYQSFTSVFNETNIGFQLIARFPFCDGSHTAHNEDTGDNVGPLVIRKKIN